MTEKRALVVEWRLTMDIPGFTVRWWIEADPEHGGVDEIVARGLVEEARGQFIHPTDMSSPLYIAGFLLNHCHCANSVEVCDNKGNGVAVHRDWP
jgi:hypothetical protein